MEKQHMNLIYFYADAKIRQISFLQLLTIIVYKKILLYYVFYKSNAHLN